MFVACAAAEKRDTVTLAPQPTVSASTSAIATAAPERPSVLTFATTPGWSGAHGNTPMSIAAIWGIDRDVYAVGPGAVLVSHDRGVRWSMSPSVGGDAVWGTSANEVFVGGGTVVMRSTDRGLTWQTTTPAPRAVAAIGGFSYDVFVAGGDSFLAHSIDHGTTWTEVSLGVFAATVFDVELAPWGLYVSGLRRESSSSAMGYHTVPVLMYSANGGRNWSNVSPPTPHQTDNEEIRKVCFTGSNTMFVAMAYSVHASNDRGATWRMATDVGTEVLGLACARHEVIVAARNKHFFASSDDGVTWREHDLDATLPGGNLIALQAAFITAGGEAFVGGEAYTKEPAGTLLRRAP